MAEQSQCIQPDLADLQARCCPACNHLGRLAFEFFSQFQYDLAADEATQQSFAETLGFCALHTWQLATISSPLGLSVGFARLVERVAKFLAIRAKSVSPGDSSIKLPRDSTECRVCRLLREAEQDYLRRLAAFVETGEGRLAYGHSEGVCLRHLGLWLPLLSNAETGRYVLEESSRHFGEILADMRSFSLKTQTRRRELVKADERDAYLRALHHLVGTKASQLPASIAVEAEG